MGFLFDSLVHLLATEPAAKRAALVRMIGRVLHVPEPRHLQAGDGLLWHFPKVTGRPMAVTLSVGLQESQGRELVALSLADAPSAQAFPIATLLQAVAEANPARGGLVELPPGCLGRSSHTWAVLGTPGPDLAEHQEYERILGSRLDLVVPVTGREASWIEAHGGERYREAMVEQGVGPWADRTPGETVLSPPTAAPE